MEKGKYHGTHSQREKSYMCMDVCAVGEICYSHFECFSGVGYIFFFIKMSKFEIECVKFTELKSIDVCWMLNFFLYFYI